MNGKNLSEQLAFSKLYEAYAPMVYRRCMFLLKDEAEAKDMVQNVFLRLLVSNQLLRSRPCLHLSLPSVATWSPTTTAIVHPVMNTSIIYKAPTTKECR